MDAAGAADAQTPPTAVIVSLVRRKTHGRQNRVVNLPT